MKRYGGLWDKFICWENLLLAARKARLGKRDRRVVQRFDFDLENELLALQRELTQGTYRPGPFCTHWISRPKSRMISAAPYRDRVVHHGLMNLLEPILDRHFHPHSYACRKGKGTHSAADRVQKLLGRHRHFVQMDVQKYFPSIDHAILKGLFRRRIKDRNVLRLMELIVDSSNEQPSVIRYFPGDDLFAPLERRRGLPIGNLTSQWFANWYLDRLDHYVTSHLGIGGYVRYCDDVVVFGDERKTLRDTVGHIRAYLAGFRLRLHEERLSIRQARLGLRFVGYRIWASHRLIPKQNIRQFRRRVRWMRKAYARGESDWETIRQRLNSWVGHARQANSERVIRRLSREWVFTRGRAANVSCSSRRQLEQ